MTELAPWLKTQIFYGFTVQLLGRKGIISGVTRPYWDIYCSSESSAPRDSGPCGHNLVRTPLCHCGYGAGYDYDYTICVRQEGGTSNYEADLRPATICCIYIRSSTKPVAVRPHRVLRMLA